MEWIQGKTQPAATTHLSALTEHKPRALDGALRRHELTYDRSHHFRVLGDSRRPS